MNKKSLKPVETTGVTNEKLEDLAPTEKSVGISPDISLPNDLLERLYQRYSIKQRRAGLECFLATSILTDLWVILAPHQEKNLETIGKRTISFLNSVLIKLWKKVTPEMFESLGQPNKRHVIIIFVQTLVECAVFRTPQFIHGFWDEE